MKLKLFLLPAFTLLTIYIFVAATKDQNGIAGYTGSPGEKTCTNTGCHTTYALNSGEGSLVIGSNIPASGYVAGTVYKMTVTITQTGLSVFGFDLEALQSNNTNAGTLAVTNTAQSQMRTSGGKNNIFHKKFTSATVGSHVFEFNWTAPAASTGEVTFYAAGNAANGNAKDDGDYIYTTTLKVSPSSISAVSNPVSIQHLHAFPNPTKELITLEYQLLTSGQVNIELQDAKGNITEQLFSGNRSAGSHTETLHFSRQHLAGIYFIRIKSGNEVEGQMIIID